MFGKICCAAVMLAVSAATARAEPIRLKLSFFTSDRELAYQAAIKPFIDSVNEEARDLLRIDAYTGGSLGENFRGQAELVAQGKADIARSRNETAESSRQLVAAGAETVRVSGYMPCPV